MNIENPGQPGPPGTLRALAHHGGEHPWLHDLFTLLFLAVIVIGIIVLVRILVSRPGGARRGTSAALTELDLRYARGELDRVDYLTRRADLSGLAVPAGDAAAEAKPKK